MCTPWPFIGTNNTFGWGVGGHGGAHSAAAATAMQCGKCHFGHFPHRWQQSTCPPCGHTQGQQMCQTVPKGGALARWVPCVPGCSPQPHACPQLKVGMPPWHPTWVMAGAAGHGHAPWVVRMHAHNASKAAGPTPRPTASPFASLVAHPKVATMPLWAPGPHGRHPHPWGAWGHTHVHCQCALKASGGGGTGGWPALRGLVHRTTSGPLASGAPPAKGQAAALVALVGVFVHPGGVACPSLVPRVAHGWVVPVVGGGVGALAGCGAGKQSESASTPTLLPSPGASS